MYRKMSVAGCSQFDIANPGPPPAAYPHPRRRAHRRTRPTGWPQRGAKGELMVTPDVDSVPRMDASCARTAPEHTRSFNRAVSKCRKLDGRQSSTRSYAGVRRDTGWLSHAGCHRGRNSDAGGVTSFREQPCRVFFFYLVFCR